MVSAINRARFHQNAPAHIRIMNARRNANGVITSIAHPNATAEMALQIRDITIMAARTVDKGVVDIQENESWSRLKIHAVPLVWYMWKGTVVLKKMRKEFDAETAGIVIPTQVRWLVNPRTIREKRENGEIAMSSVVFIIKGSRVAQSLVKKESMVAGVWY